MSQRNYIEEQVSVFISRLLKRYMHGPPYRQMRGAHIVDRYALKKKLTIVRATEICRHYNDPEAAERMRLDWNDSAAVLMNIRAYLWLNAIGVKCETAPDADLN